MAGSKARTSKNGIDQISIDNNVEYKEFLSVLKTTEIRWVFYFNVKTHFQCAYQTKPPWNGVHININLKNCMFYQQYRVFECERVRNSTLFVSINSN